MGCEFSHLLKMEAYPTSVLGGRVASAVLIVRSLTLAVAEQDQIILSTGDMQVCLIYKLYLKVPCHTLWGKTPLMAYK